MKKGHIGYMDALNDLLGCLYVYQPSDYENLLRSLKDGLLSVNGKCYSSADIADPKATKLFRDRYAKYLRKKLREPETMVQMLDDWFCKYKVTASADSRPDRGRIDPVKGVTLFSSETRTAVKNEWLSRRGESKLECFRDRFAHFANGGMRKSLADGLNLCGTARYNLAIRHKRRLMVLAPENLGALPAGREKVVPFWNPLN